MEHKLYTAWIDVKNEMPFEDGLYLVACTEFGTADVRVMTYYSEFNEWDKYEKHDKWDLSVTHWMAFPSPPGNDEQYQHAKCAVCSMDIFKEPGCKWQHKGGQSFFIDAYGAHMPEPRNEQTEG